MNGMYHKYFSLYYLNLSLYLINLTMQLKSVLKSERNAFIRVDTDYFKIYIYVVRTTSLY